MNDAEAEAINDSFVRLNVAHPDFAEDFYVRLFDHAPGVRSLFPEHLGLQASKLANTVTIVVQNIQDPEPMLSAVIDMAKRHVGYGAQPEHYDVVKTVLLETLADLAPGGFSDQEMQAWDKALGAICALMVSHAYGDKVA